MASFACRQQDPPMLARSIIFCSLIAPPLLAQDSTLSRTVDHADEPRPRVTMGLTTGTMSFADQRVQQSATGVARYHFAPSLSLALSPTFARVSFPSTLGGGSVSGLTDLPLELAADHSFDVPWSPTAGLSLGASLPVGNRAVGFGSGNVGGSIGVGVGASPLDPLSLHVGVGKSLNDYSFYSTLGASDAVWGDLEASYQLMNRLEATFGFDGDLASSDSIGPARAVALSVALNLGGPYTLTLNGGHGISGAAARWTIAVGFGTDFAGIQAIGSSSPIQRFMRSLGGGSNRGPGSTSSGHGRGP
jgi:hypothetical protein